MLWAKMPFPTRMTVIRLEHGLFVHSPTQLNRALQEKIEEIGPVRWDRAQTRVPMAMRVMSYGRISIDHRRG
jgi:hypothetical protein